MKYQTKPFIIEAVQFTGENIAEIIAFVDAASEYTDGFVEAGRNKYEVWDYLQDTWVNVNVGDYIIKGMKDEFYPCDSEVFEAKYTPLATGVIFP